MKTQSKFNFRKGYKFVPVLTILLLTLAAFTDDLNRNTLQYSSSITGFQNNSAPVGWFLSGARPDNYKTGIDTAITQHGHKSAFIESVSENPEGFSTLMQQCNVKDYKGKRVKMTGYLKTQGADATASMWSRVDDFDKKIVADFDNMGDRPISGNSDWTKCEIVFDVPDSKCAVAFGFIFSGTGKIWIDNVSFEIVSNTTEKTAFSLNQDLPEEMTSRIPDVLPEKVPANLDFEN
jgi:hypothetical protein